MPHLLQANQRGTLKQPYRSAQMDTSYFTPSRMRQEAVNYFCGKLNKHYLSTLPHGGQA